MTFHSNSTLKLSNETISFINSLINENNFSQLRFDIWVNDNKITDKSVPDLYVRKIFRQELDKGTFKPDTKILYIQPLLNTLRDMGVEILQNNDDLYLNAILDYLYIEKIMTYEEILDNLSKAKDYFSKLSGQTLTDFIREFLKSKAIRNKNIDFSKIELRYKDYVTLWNKEIERIN